jgi:myo-inositol-hexaphosphate 3-phosphohydrolase
MLLSACTGCHSDTAQDAATSVTAIAAPVAGAPEQTADPANYNHAMSPQQQAIIQRHKDAQ